MHWCGFGADSMVVCLAKYLSSFDYLPADSFPIGLAKNISSLLYWRTGFDAPGLAAYSNRTCSKFYCR